MIKDVWFERVKKTNVNFPVNFCLQNILNFSQIKIRKIWIGFDRDINIAFRAIFIP